MLTKNEDKLSLNGLEVHIINDSEHNVSIIKKGKESNYDTSLDT